MLAWKCVSRHNGVHFFDISTSESGPDMLIFLNVDLEMCIAQHRIFRKWSEHVVAYRVDLEMCFAQQKACNLSSPTRQVVPHPLFWQISFPTLWNHKSLEKKIVNRVLLTFLRAVTFPFFDLLSSSLFRPDSSHLCFSISPSCPKFNN